MALSSDRKENKQQPAWIEPMTSWSWGVRSTAVPLSPTSEFNESREGQKSNTWCPLTPTHLSVVPVVEDDLLHDHVLLGAALVGEALLVRQNDDRGSSEGHQLAQDNDPGE